MPIGLVPALIMGGATVAGAGIAAHASDKAASEQEQAAQQALGFQQQQYNAAQTQLAPYRNLAAGALGNLQSLAAMPVVSPNASGWGFQAPPAPGALGNLSTASVGGVLLQAPTGEQRMVPAAQAAAFIARGARPIGSVYGQQAGGSSVTPTAQPPML